MDPTPTSPLPSTHPSLAERRVAAGVHLGAMLLAFCTSWLAGVAGMVGAGIVAAVRPMDSDFVASHAKAAFNFNASLLVYFLLGLLITVFTLGIALVVILPLVAIVALTWFVCSIVAASRAIEGKPYTYPLAIRML